MSSNNTELKSLMTLEEVLQATGGKLVGKSENFFFEFVATDSRNVKENTMFVPLVGEKQDGHKYIPSSIENGAKVILVNESEYEKNGSVYDNLSNEKNVCFVIVENTLYGLQDAARGYVEKFPNLIKCAITGSSGKTTTKEMVVSVLKQKYNCVYTEGNFNSETGLPLSVFKIRNEHECGIFEMGMNRKNEIGEIANVLKPKYAIITNIGNAHIGLLGSRENIATEKRKIFDYLGKDGAAFIPENDDFADFITENVSGKIVKFGKSVSEKESKISYKKSNGLFGTLFTLNGVEINLPISGEYNYQNALSAVAIAKELGVSDEEIKTGLENFRNVGGRMEVTKTVLCNGNDVTIVKDCYNANPDSMEKVIELCKDEENKGNKIFVLGDMKELGEKSEEEHREIYLKVTNYKVKACFVGPEFKNAISKTNVKNPDAVLCDSVESPELKDFVLENAVSDSLVLLKGSNSMQLWNLLPKIEMKEQEGK